MEENKDLEFIKYIVKSIVNNPDEVTVTRTVDEMGVLLEVKTNPEDMGLIIGRQGATAKAMRTLVRTVGMKAKARINLRIFDPREEKSAKNVIDSMND